MIDFKYTEYLIYNISSRIFQNCGNWPLYLISSVFNVDTTSWEVVSTYNGNNVLQQHDRKWRNSAKLALREHKMDHGNKVMKSGSNAS